MKHLLEDLQIKDEQRFRQSTGTPRRSPRSRKRWLIGLFLLSAAAGGSVYFAKTRAIPVDVLTVPPLFEADAAGPTLTAGGYVKDPKVVYVVPRVAGRIVSLTVKEGDEVKAEDLIALLDTRDLQQEVGEARANVDQAGANLEKLRAGSRPEEISEAKAKLQAAVFARERSKKELSRSTALFREGVLSEQLFDQARTEDLINEKNADATRQSLALIEAGARKEEIQMAEAALAATRARLEAAKNRLGYAEVRAPISGRVLKKLRETGDYVSPDVPFVQGYDTVAVGSPVVSVAARERQEVSADINETDLSKVSLHQPVEITPNAYPSETFHGSVTQISPHADKNKNTIEVKATFEQSAKTLPYDMSVKLRFLRSASRPARRAPPLPSGAVLRKDGKHFVFLVVDSRAVLRQVETAPEQDGRLSLVSGVAEGDQVITSQIAAIKQGSKVVPR